MAKLVKIIGDDLVIADYRVAGPGYIMYVSDGVSGNGWIYYAEDVVETDFDNIWKSTEIYNAGDTVLYGTSLWQSIYNNNNLEPGVKGWVDTEQLNMTSWSQPTGAHDAYPLDAIVSYGTSLWRSLVAANVWEPGVSSWREIPLMREGAVVVPEWIQPTGAQDAYNIGDHVMHNSQEWVSTVDANVWEPGVFGWDLV